MCEWRRQVNLFLGKNAAPSASPRALDAFKVLKWSILQNHVWLTPFGQIRVGWISDAALTKLVHLSWTRVLFQSDTKTLEHLPDRLNPYLGFHKAVIKEGGERYKKTVLMAAASDGRLLERMGVPEVCACGLRSPDREHLTFHCPAQTADLPVLKTHNETRLLQPLVPLPSTPNISALGSNAELVQCLRQLYAVDHAPVILALDGSCLVNPGNDLYQWASWGIVTATKFSFQGLLQGCIHTPAAAEREALVQAMLAAHTAAVPVRLLIDNEAIVKRLLRGLRFGSWNGDAAGFWFYIATLVIHGVEVMWVPSHDKKPSWTPALDWNLSAQDCRKLNELADHAAAQISDSKREEFLLAKKNLTDAHAWASCAFLRQWKATRPFHERVTALQKAKHRFPLPT